MKTIQEMVQEATGATGTLLTLSLVGIKEIEAFAALVREDAQPKKEPAPGYCKHCKQYSIDEPLPPQPQHWSDCAVHNEPAYPAGECDCGGYTPQQEPVAYLYEVWDDNCDAATQGKWRKNMTYLPLPLKDCRNIQPLYTSPPPVATQHERTWIGLTDEEIQQIVLTAQGNEHWTIVFARALEAKLKAKNETAQD